MRRLILIMLCSLSLFSLGAQKNNQGTKKINIRDIFLMLPEKAVDNRWSVEDRKTQKTSHTCWGTRRRAGVDRALCGGLRRAQWLSSSLPFLSGSYARGLLLEPQRWA